MELNWNTLIGSGGILGVAYLVFATGIFFGKFKAFVTRTDKSLEDIKSSISGITSRVDRLEVRVEERTLKVFHIENTGTYSMPPILPSTREEGRR